MPYIGKKPADIIATAVDTTTGTFSGDIDASTVNATGDTAAGDNAAIGFTSAEGLILTGQGSTSDITVKNDADATVFTVPTGTDDILFPDNAKAMFGAGSDLQIYHDGSNSYIDDNGTGNLLIRAENLVLEDLAGNNYFTGAHDGAAKIYHINNLKLETTTSGVNITGTMSADNQIFIEGATNDTARVNFGDSDDVDIGFISYNNADNHMQFGTNTSEAMRINSNQQVGIATGNAVGNPFQVGTPTTDKRGSFQGSNQYRLAFQNGSNAVAYIGSGGANSIRLSNSAGSSIFMAEPTYHRFHNSTGQFKSDHSVTLADDASVTLQGATAGGNIFCVYETSQGSNAVYRIGYQSSAIISEQESGTTAFTVGDTDGQACVITSNHDVTFKNRIGASKTFNFAIFGTGNV